MEGKRLERLAQLPWYLKGKISDSCASRGAQRITMNVCGPFNRRYCLRRSDTILGNFDRDSLHGQRFQTLITMLFEDRLVSN